MKAKVTRAQEHKSTSVVGSWELGVGRGGEKETRIVVRNINKRFNLNERFIKKIAEEILNILKKRKGTKLEIIFLSDDEIKHLNRKYRKKNTATDVLSFELDDLGEIIISSDKALKNSAIFNTSFEREIVLYVIHGILHLSGYDDETTRGRERMSKKEDLILKRLCQKNFLKVLMPQ